MLFCIEGAFGCLACWASPCRVGKDWQRGSRLEDANIFESLRANLRTSQANQLPLTFAVVDSPNPDSRV